MAEEAYGGHSAATLIPRVRARHNIGPKICKRSLGHQYIRVDMILEIVAVLFMLNLFRRYLFTTPPKMSKETVDYVQKLIKEKPVLIASKTYCPYCTKAKNTIKSITLEAYILELDELDNGAEIQDALYQITSQRTVPNVFIGSEHIGGNSDVQALQSQDKLESKIKAAL